MGIVFHKGIDRLLNYASVCALLLSEGQYRVGRLIRHLFHDLQFVIHIGAMTEVLTAARPLEERPEFSLGTMMMGSSNM